MAISQSSGSGITAGVRSTSTAADSAAGPSDASRSSRRSRSRATYARRSDRADGFRVVRCRRRDAPGHGHLVPVALVDDGPPEPDLREAPRAVRRGDER